MNSSSLRQKGKKPKTQKRKRKKKVGPDQYPCQKMNDIGSRYYLAFSIKVSTRFLSIF